MPVKLIPNDPMTPPGTGRCRCTACGEYFGGERGFDMHRVGVFPDSRRCLNPTEMLGIGLQQVSSGHWARIGPGSLPRRPFQAPNATEALP